MPESGVTLSLVPDAGGDWSVVHAIPGRVRIKAEPLRGDRERSAALRDHLRVQPGITRVAITPSLGSLTLRYAQHKLSRQDVLELFQRGLERLSDLTPAVEEESTSLLMRDGHLASLALGLAATPLLPVPARYAVTLASISPSLVHSVLGLREGGKASDLLDSAALVLSTLAGRYGVTQINNLMHVLSRKMEEQAVDETEAQLRQRGAPPQPEYRVALDGREQSRLSGELQAGDRLRLTGDEIVPLESIVTEGSARVAVGFRADEATVGPGHRLAAGSRLLEGELELACLQDWSDGNFARLASFIEIAIRNRENHDAYAAGMADRLVPVTVLLSAAVYGFTRDLARTSSAAQADFGAASELVTPLGIESTVAAGAEGGILFRGGDAIEGMAHLDTLVFDRSGTLTRGEWRLSQVKTTGNESEEFCRALVGRLIYGCCRQAAGLASDGEVPPVVTLSHAEIEQIQHHGLHMRREGALLGLVTIAAAERQFEAGIELEDRLPGSVGVSFCLLLDGACIALVRFSDSLSPGNIAGVEALRSQGVANMYLISHEPSASLHPELAGLPLDGFHTGLSELDKLHFIEELLDRGDRVGLVSDGLFQVGGDCLSICLGAAPDARPLDADVWLMSADICSLADAHRLALQSTDRLKTGHRFSLVGKGSMLLASSFDLIPPAVSAALGNSALLATMRYVRAIDRGDVS